MGDEESRENSQEVEKKQDAWGKVDPQVQPKLMQATTMDATSPDIDLKPHGLGTSLPKLVLSSDTANNNAEEWSRWWQRFEIYLLASGLDKADDKRKIAIMLHSMGTKGLEIFNSFNLDLDKCKLIEIKKKFDNHFEPQKNLTMSRYIFFMWRQMKSESIDDFLTDLENKSKDCEFKDLRESLIRDICIANMNTELSHVRQRLLQEPNLTYARMRELAKAVIAAQRDSDRIVKENTGNDTKDVNSFMTKTS